MTATGKGRWRWLALGASLAVHGLLAAVAWHWPASGGDGPRELDTRVTDRECTLIFYEPEVVMTVSLPAEPRQPPAVALPPPTPIQAANGNATPAVIKPATPPSPSAGAPAAGQTGPPQAPAFFQIPFKGRSVVYLIDRSSSMGEQGRMALARKELVASLAQLPEAARFQILVYNRQAEPLRIGAGPGLLPATAANKERAAAFLNGLLAEGSTDHLPALRSALVLEPDVIYFLTDADDLKAEQVRLISQLNHGRCVIHAIELNPANRDRTEMPLHVLARLNGGTYTAARRVP